MADDFYKSARWQRLRAAALRRDNYQCQLEARRGRLVEAEVVHHIFPREQFPEYQWELWNLISITAENHRQLHEKYGNKLTPVGERLRAEVAAREGIPLSRLVLVGGDHDGARRYVRGHLLGGLVYDEQAIAGAFRLDAGESGAALRMARSMRRAFAVNARRYAGLVFVVAESPSVADVEALEPDELVLCGAGDWKKDLMEWAAANRIPVEEAQ